MVRQLLIENAMLSILGAGLAIPLAFAIVEGVTAFLPVGNIARTIELTPDAIVIQSTIVAGLASGIVMSILPIAMAWPRRENLAIAWHRTTARGTTRWVRGLLVLQVALSLVLVVGAGLLGRSLYLLQHVDPGIDPCVHPRKTRPRKQSLELGVLCYNHYRVIILPETGAWVLPR